MASKAPASELAAGNGGFPVPAPRPPKRKREVVLEEDEWTGAIEAIIERDYFPDIPKVQSKLEWLQAVRSGNPALIRQAQLNIAQRRAGIKTPMLDAGGLPLATPATDFGATFGATPALGGVTPAAGRAAGGGGAAAAAAGGAGAGAGAPRESLDAFMVRHTSEDNASFREILDADNARRLAKRPELAARSAPLAIEGPHPTDGYGTSGQAPGSLTFWKHTPKSTLMYPAAQTGDAPYTPAELAQRVAGAPKSIAIAATRLPGGGGAARPDTGDGAVGAGGGGAGGSGGGGAPDQEPQHGPPGRAYEYVATPSMTPGPEASPLVTWGEIGGTPLRLDADDLDVPLPPGGGGGVQFAVQAPRARERLARELTGRGGRLPGRRGEGGGGSARRGSGLGGAPLARAGTPLDAASLLRARTGTGAGVGAAGGGKPPLSEAGRRLAAALRRGTPRGGDAQLRASYKGGGSARGGSAIGAGVSSCHTTPGATPVARERSSGGARRAAPGGGAAGGAAAGAHVTDNLLNI